MLGSKPTMEDFEEIRAGFKILDLNSDGTIDIVELRKQDKKIKAL